MDINLLKKLEGLQTVDTVSSILNISKQSAINLISRLKKEGHVKTTGGGTQKRIYKVSIKKFRENNENNMFSILNRYSKNKVNPLFNHVTNDKNYSVENAIVDLIELNNTRILINMLPLFNHVKNWTKLFNLALKKNVENNVYSLYLIAKKYTKVRKMPKRYDHDIIRFNFNEKDLEDIYK